MVQISGNELGKIISGSEYIKDIEEVLESILEHEGEEVYIVMLKVALRRMKYEEGEITSEVLDYVNEQLSEDSLELFITK